MSDNRTLPVTPAERTAAAMLQAWLAWEPDMTDRGPVHHMLVMFGTAAVVADLVDAETDDLTPAGRELLARVGAAERTPRPLPAYLARFPQGPASQPSEHPAAEQQPIVPRLSERARKVLEKLSLAEPRDFAGLKWIDLLRVDGCGTKTRAELLAWAGEHGAHLIHRLPKREREALASKEPAR